MTARGPLILPPDRVWSNSPPRGVNPLALYAWHAYNRFTKPVRDEIKRGNAGSAIVAAAFREYDRPMSARDRRRAFDELMRVHALRGGGVL